jgi:hypothetical protein
MVLNAINFPYRLLSSVVSHTPLERYGSERGLDQFSNADEGMAPSMHATNRN